MELREATDADLRSIRQIAEASLDASYSDELGEDAVYRLTEEWYDRERVSDRLADESVLYVVAETDEGVVGFAEVELADPERTGGEIQWLHVHPNHRGEGVGRELLTEVEDRIRASGATRIEGVVLAANEAGNEFYRDNGYTLVGEQTVPIGEHEFVENTYGKRESDAGHRLEAREDDGKTVYVALDEAERGNLGPFLTAYVDADATRLYGYYCANCESFDTTMDAMGRIECSACGNHRKPSRWDSAYL